MPELPEVETYVRELAPLLTGRQVCAAEVFWPRTIAAPDADAFQTQIVGQQFATFGRRGKYMLLGLASGATLIVHLRMTGHLQVEPAGTAPDKHTHVLLDLDSGERLLFRDSRKFGRIWLVDEAAPVLARLGPEPLSNDFTPDGLGQRLAGRQAAIKALLLDQAIVAGIGNIYADEALFRAGVHPLRHGGSLTSAELARLHLAVCMVLADGIAAAGSSLGVSSIQNYQRPGGQPGSFQEQHRVFQRTGQPCLVCGAPIARIVIAQRSTHFCPGCQT
ncbi:MAG: bifunctional DNA-formamidopyrimidine glycosylase/DNA-(apurinic or apyrimidinic site) lyase [Caldilineaceae bacterium]|nr:bifunctional DNA-formamidopyrimidine glycosylase/DNA-(apurinic or apyrimidinic site) lyase [Caldilineaceae bacterium]